jgi:acylglycerol lipase
MRRIKKFIVGGLGLVLLAMGIAAWMGAQPSVGPCSAALPKGAFESFRMQSQDGNCLQGYAWQPSGKPVLGVALLAHGIHDHARRYESLATSLNQIGIAVYAWDQRGHGASGGARQRVDSAEQLVADMHLTAQFAAQRHPGVPTFAYGHSMGGMVALHYALAHGTSLKGLVLSSAALKLPDTASAAQINVLKVLSTLAPGLPVEEVDEGKLVRVPAARDVLAADPMIIREKVPARSVATILNGIQSAQARFADLALPVLVLHGAADQVTLPAGSSALAAQATSKDKALKLYDGALHDLLHEPEGSHVTQEISAFMGRQLVGAKP